MPQLFERVLVSYAHLLALLPGVLLLDCLQPTCRLVKDVGTKGKQKGTKITLQQLQEVKEQLPKADAPRFRWVMWVDSKGECVTSKQTLGHLWPLHQPNQLGSSGQAPSHTNMYNTLPGCEVVGLDSGSLNSRCG